MSVYCVYAWCLLRAKKGIGSPRTGVMNGCEAPRGCWELNLGPLQEQGVLLTTKPPLLPVPIVLEFFALS